MNMTVAIFWAVLGLVAMAMTLAGHLGRVETEKTIRMAIDKGAVLDSETVERLKRAASMPWAVRLIAFGIVVLFCAAGMAVFAIVLAFDEPESLPPLLAIAGLIGCVGAGLLTCGLWLRRVWKEPT